MATMLANRRSTVAPPSKQRRVFSLSREKFVAAVQRKTESEQSCEKTFYNCVAV